MKRDEAFLIEVLKEMEQSEAEILTVKLERSDKYAKYFHHLLLLKDRGFVSTIDYDLGGKPKNSVLSFRLTDAGHNYLEEMRQKGQKPN